MPTKPFDAWELEEVLELLEGVPTIGDAHLVLKSELPEDQFDALSYGFTDFYDEDHPCDRESVTAVWVEFVETPVVH